MNKKLEFYSENKDNKFRQILYRGGSLSHKYLYLGCHSCESRNPEPLLLDSRLHGNDEKSVKKCYRQDTNIKN